METYSKKRASFVAALSGDALGERLRWRLLTIVAAGLCCVAAILGALQLAYPEWPGLLPLSESHLARAQARLAPDDASPIDLRAAERELERAIALSPRRPEAWLLLSSARRRLAGHVAPEDLKALERSYEVAPIDPDIDMWRTAYVFDSWSRMSPVIRRRANNELDAMMTRCGQRPRVGPLLASIDDPAGRMAFQLRIARLQVATPSLCGA